MKRRRRAARTAGWSSGQLDSQTAGQIMGLLRSIVHDQGIAAIVATHDRALIDIPTGRYCCGTGCWPKGRKVRFRPLPDD